VALLATRNLEGAGVTCVVSYYGAHDLNQTTPEGVQANTTSPEALIGATKEEKPDAWKAASASTHISKDDPPFLLIHGDKDTTVPLSESTEFQKKLKAAGVACELITVTNGGHGLNSRAGAEVSPTLEAVDAKLEAFLKKHLRPVAPAKPTPAPTEGGDGK
jgi:dipeptidyl aminopeptidase/acylaminoacyl peptidase